jgi:hypothetical protein
MMRTFAAIADSVVFLLIIQMTALGNTCMIPHVISTMLLSLISYASMYSTMLAMKTDIMGAQIS